MEKQRQPLAWKLLAIYNMSELFKKMKTEEFKIKLYFVLVQAARESKTFNWKQEGWTEWSKVTQF